MLFVIKLIKSKWLFQKNTALYICFAIVKRPSAIVKEARFGPQAVLWGPLIYRVATKSRTNVTIDGDADLLNRVYRNFEFRIGSCIAANGEHIEHL